MLFKRLSKPVTRLSGHFASHFLSFFRGKRFLQRELHAAVEFAVQGFNAPFSGDQLALDFMKSS